MAEQHKDRNVDGDDTDVIGVPRGKSSDLPRRDRDIEEEELRQERLRDAKRRREENDGEATFKKAQPELCDDLFTYSEAMEIAPNVGFWEPFLMKMSRRYLRIGVVIACFDDDDGSFDNMVFAAYGLVREVNPFIFEVIPFDKAGGSASKWPYVGRLSTTEYVFCFNSYGLSNIPRGIMDTFAVEVHAVYGAVEVPPPPPYALPGMPTTLGDTSYKAKLNADKLMGIKVLLRHDKKKSERLFGALEIMDNHKAKASIASVLLKSQLSMVMLQPQNLPMLVTLIHSRSYVPAGDLSKTVAGLHFMHFEEPNTKPLFHKRIKDCAFAFVAVLKQIAGGDPDRYWATMFGPFLDLLVARDDVCMEKMQPRLVMDSCSEALVKWSLMMAAEGTKGVSDSELMELGQEALFIDIDKLDRQASREFREKTERGSTVGALAAGAAAGRGRGRGGFGGGGGGGGRGGVTPFAGHWGGAGGAGGVGGGGAPGRAGVRYCIDAVCYHLLGRVSYDGRPVLTTCTKGKQCSFEHTLPTIPCEPAEKADLLVTAEYVRRFPQKYSALLQVMSAPTFSK